MKKISVIIVLAAVVLGGCIQTETKIKVDRNGSGTIERSLIMRSDVVQMLKSMQAFDPAKKDAGILDAEKLEKDAENLGPGVKFESAVPVKNKTGEGYKAVYSFRDIGTLKINQTPGDELPSSEMGGDRSAGSEEFVTFEFSKGNPATLLIHLYQKGEKAGEEEEDPEEGETAAMDPAMLEQFYRDMKLGISVEVVGTIVDTDADYRSGSSVTLLDIDFNNLMKTPEARELLSGGSMKSLEDMTAFSRKYPGLRLETKDTVNIRFR
jgi:hypothetical protein